MKWQKRKRSIQENLKLTKQKSYFFINLSENRDKNKASAIEKKRKKSLSLGIQAIVLAAAVYEIMQNERMMMEKTNAT